MARGQPQILVRMSPSLKAAIQAAAAINGRSVNAEINSGLERVYLPLPIEVDRPATDPTLEKIDRLIDIYEKK